MTINRLALDQFSTTEAADCGCQLGRNTKGTVTFRYCSLHTAAPDLLAALKRTSAVLDRATVDGRVNIGMKNVASVQAHATIEKAEGAQS